MLITIYYIVTILFTALMTVLWSRRWGANLLIKLTALVLCIASVVMLLREHNILIRV